MKVRWMMALALAAGLALGAAAGTVAYRTVKVERKWGQCKQAYENCVVARAAYPQLTSAGTDAAKSAVNQAIVDRLLRSPVSDKPAADVESMLDGVVKEYRDNAGPSYAMGWEYQINVEVKYNAAGLFCLAFNEYSYLGGAHPNSMTTFVNFETKNGRVLQLEDIIDRKNLGKLETRAEAKFRKARGLSPTADLGEAGYFFDHDKFALNRNFTIAKDGLTFLYNPYEIAAYVEGPITIEFKWSELQDLLAAGPVHAPLP